jgi:Zn-finger nucleic acid-binding protein
MADVEVDQCNKCSGIWFDFGELQDVLDQENIDRLKNVVDNNAGQDERKSSCPRCGGEGTMVQVTSFADKGVHIDTCPVCYGQWLDGGELEALKSKGMFGSVSGFFRHILGG